jgi:hypothetical protein
MPVGNGMNAPFSVATFDHIPEELKRHHQWVGWRFERTDQGKPTNVPYNVRTGYHASTTDPQTWAPFVDAVAAVAAGHVIGIGFVFTERDPYCGIDLDTPVDPETGVSLLDPVDGARQQSIFQAMNSYSERPRVDGACISSPRPVCRTGASAQVLKSIARGASSPSRVTCSMARRFRTGKSLSKSFGQNLADKQRQITSSAIW